MIACAQCQTSNTLDSQFCRKCGTALAADVLVEARAELDALVAKGTAAFEDGRIEDAMAIAEEAVLTDPAHANAHALKGMAHERRGEIAKALEEYERVCDLNPDSALDRLKLSGLRAALAERATAPGPDRRTPVLAGVSAAVLLACLGFAGVKMLGGPKAETAVGNEAGRVASASTPTSDGTTPVASVPGLGVGTARPNTVLGKDDVQPVGSENAAAPSVTETPVRGGALPRPRNDARGGYSGGISGGAGSLPEMEIAPAPIPGGTIGGTLPNPAGPSRPLTRTAPGTGLDPTPRPQTQDPAPAPNTPSPTGNRPKKNDGYIDIQVEGGSNGGNADRASSGNGAEALTRVGKAHAQSGDYGRAAQAFERAIAAGADPAATNQRLGQAYERLGRKGEAKQAYGRSADGYRRKVATGKADERDKNGLDSVNQAMKVLDRG